MRSGDVRHAAKLGLPFLLVAVSRYGTSVRYRAAWLGDEIHPNLQYEVTKISPPKIKASIAISLMIVARMRSRHLSSKVDRCLSLLHHHLVKVNLQLAVGS